MIRVTTRTVAFIRPLQNEPRHELRKRPDPLSHTPAQAHGLSSASFRRPRSSTTARSSCAWPSPQTLPAGARPSFAARCVGRRRRPFPARYRLLAPPSPPLSPATAVAQPAEPAVAESCSFSVCRRHSRRQLFASPHGALTTSSTDVFMGQARAIQKRCIRAPRLPRHSPARSLRSPLPSASPHAVQQQHSFPPVDTPPPAVLRVPQPAVRRTSSSRASSSRNCPRARPWPSPFRSGPPTLPSRTRRCSTCS